MLKAILIDDEPEALSALRTILTDFFPGKITVLAAEDAPLEGIKKIQQLKPDVVFLDIEMQGGTGFDIAETFPDRTFRIIFVTAYEEYALRALKLKAYDYLLKPVDIDEVRKIIDDLLKIKKTENNGKKSDLHKICLPTQNETYFVEPGEIIFIRSDGRYSEVMLNSGKKIYLAKNLGSFEDELIPYNFIRIHKSFLANLKHIKGLSNTDGWFANMSNGHAIEVSKKKIGELKAILAENTSR